jgi:hypothetical protein
MKPNYYSIFRKRIIEQDEIAIDPQSTLEKVLQKSKKITGVLTTLLTSQEKFNDRAKKEIREIISDIRFVSYKPTTFRVVIKNGNYFDLKYDPTPLELSNPEDYDPKDSFVVVVSGKKYNITNKSELEQALDYINNLLQSSPITKEPQSIEEPGAGAEGGGEGEAGGAEPAIEEPPTPPEEEEK